VCQAIENGVRRAVPDAMTVVVPMADGGEGTMQALVERLKGSSLVFTGEGRLDSQTARGKVPVGVARRSMTRG